MGCRDGVMAGDDGRLPSSGGLTTWCCACCRDSCGAHRPAGAGHQACTDRCTPRAATEHLEGSEMDCGKGLKQNKAKKGG